MSVTSQFREAGRHLITSVALITSTGRWGRNVMSAEWAFQVSYRPMRIAVLVHPEDATHDNILESKEFGASFLSEDQAGLANLAGHYTGKDVSKLSSEIIRTYPGKTIRVPMVSDCLLNLECQLAKVLDTGDHAMFLGDVVHAEFDRDRKPLLYSQGRYWQRGTLVDKQTLVYLTCTLVSGQIRLEGRVLGAPADPQNVNLTLSPSNSSPILRDTAKTDERGYFGLVKPFPSLQTGVHIATAEWEGIEGKATLTVE